MKNPRPLCKCGNLAERGLYTTYCTSCKRARKGRNSSGVRIEQDYIKGPICERCEFVPEHPAQLEIDHIDGNSSNNTPGNHQTLCANCHRLKTMINGDHLTKCVSSMTVQEDWIGDTDIQSAFLDF